MERATGSTRASPPPSPCASSGLFRRRLGTGNGFGGVAFVAAAHLACVLAILFCVTSVTSIRCYKCNEIDKPYVPCPGWHRRPVDTYLDLKDRGGLFTHCLEIRLANGTVIRQDAVPEKPSCESRFRRVWQQTLGMDYRMRVSVRCCDSSLCNGPNGRAGGGDRWPTVMLVFSVTLAHVYASKCDFRERWRLRTNDLSW